MAEEPSLDELLDGVERVIARLGEAREPVENLVVAYEDGVRLLAAAQARLEGLAEKAGVAR